MNHPSPADHLTFYTYHKRQILVGIKTEWKLISQRILWVNIHFCSFAKQYATTSATAWRYHTHENKKMHKVKQIHKVRETYFTEICMDHPENINTNHRWSSDRMEIGKHCHTYLYTRLGIRVPFSKGSKLALRPTTGYSGALSLRIKRPGARSWPFTPSST